MSFEKTLVLSAYVFVSILWLATGCTEESPGYNYGDASVPVDDEDGGNVGVSTQALSQYEYRNINSNNGADLCAIQSQQCLCQGGNVPVFRTLRTQIMRWGQPYPNYWTCTAWNATNGGCSSSDGRYLMGIYGDRLIFSRPNLPDITARVSWDPQCGRWSQAWYDGSNVYTWGNPAGKVLIAHFP